MRILVFSGPKGSGKDTAANYLLARSSLLRPGLFVQSNFADNVRLCCATVFGFTDKEMTDPQLKEIVVDRWPDICPREGQQNFANLMRSVYSPYIWVKAWERKIKGMLFGCLIVTDLRFPEELEKFEELGAKIIYVQNDQVEAIMKEKQAAGDPLWSNISETFYDLIKLKADAIITNNGSIPELHAQVHEVAQSFFGSWGEWVDFTNGPNVHTELGHPMGLGVSSQEKVRL